MQVQCFKHTNSKKLLLNEMQMCKDETLKSPSQTCKEQMQSDNRNLKP
jgi:hypothetical protein